MSQDKLIFTGRELFTLPNESDNYIIDGLLWENQVVMLLAKEKVGKSILALQLACSVSCGEDFLGQYEVSGPRKVLYIQTESTRQETVERLRSMTTEVSWNPDNFYLLTTHALSLDTAVGLKNLIAEIEQAGFKPDLIALDPLYMSMEGSLVDDLACRCMSRNIRELAKRFNSAVVVVHHEHRSRRGDKGVILDEGDNSIMGSFVWKAFPNHIIHLQLKPEGLRSLSCRTQRSSRVIEDMLLQLVSEPLHYKIAGSTDHHPSYDHILGLIQVKGPISAEDIKKVTGFSIATVRRALAYWAGYKVGKVRKVNPGKRPVLYGLNSLGVKEVGSDRG